MVGAAVWTADAGTGTLLIKSQSSRGSVGREESVHGGFPAASSFFPRTWGQPLPRFCWLLEQEAGQLSRGQEEQRGAGAHRLPVLFKQQKNQFP